MIDMCQVIIIIIIIIIMIIITIVIRSIIVQKHLQEIIQCQDAVEHWKLEAQNAAATIGKQTQDGDWGRSSQIAQTCGVLFGTVGSLNYLSLYDRHVSSYHHHHHHHHHHNRTEAFAGDHPVPRCGGTLEVGGTECWNNHWEANAGRRLRSQQPEREKCGGGCRIVQLFLYLPTSLQVAATMVAKMILQES